jgi:hypothetical protein
MLAKSVQQLPPAKALPRGCLYERSGTASFTDPGKALGPGHAQYLFSRSRSELATELCV